MYTRTTRTLRLPQYLPFDRPQRVDVNTACQTIDDAFAVRPAANEEGKYPAALSADLAQAAAPEGLLELRLGGIEQSLAGKAELGIDGKLQDEALPMAEKLPLRAVPELEAGNVQAAIDALAARFDATGAARNACALGGVEAGQITGIAALLAQLCAQGAGPHNAFYRGKNLGSSVSASQWEAISCGSFHDLFIGDYWSAGGICYRIAAFDYYLRTGDQTCADHHLVLVPDTSLCEERMNESDTTAGGYRSSRLRMEGLLQAKARVNALFGSSHLLSHRQYLHSAVTAGYASGGGWTDSTLELMTERNVFGCQFYGNQQNGSALADNRTLERSRFPLFAFRPDLVQTGQDWWLRDVASAQGFSAVGADGTVRAEAASSVLGVRPAFAIK